MKRYVFLCALAVLVAFSSSLEAVSITTSGGGDASVRRPAPASGNDLKTSEKGTSGLFLLDLPAAETDRLAEAAKLVMLTGLQAKNGLNKLTELDGRNVPGTEIIARLVYAQKCMEAMEKAGKKLEDSAKLVMMTWEGRFGPEDRLAALEELLGATPALAWQKEHLMDVPTDTTLQSTQEWGRNTYPPRSLSRQKTAPWGKEFFNNSMNKLVEGGKAVKNFAFEMGGTIKSAVGKVKGAVSYAHHRIGSVVGQKNWANIMAGTKYLACVAGTGVGIALAAPATGVAGLGAISVGLVATAGATASFASDLAVINEFSLSSKIQKTEKALSMINKGLTVVNIVASWEKPAEVVLSIVDATSDTIVGSGNIQYITDDELESYLESKNDFLSKYGARITYLRPIDTRDDERDGDGEGGGGGSCGH